MFEHSLLIIKSWKNYKKYKKTRELEDLAQAGEKVWFAFNSLIEKKTGKKLKNYRELKKAITDLYEKTGSEMLLRTFRKAYDLHVFFHGGYTEDVRDVENNYLEVVNSIKVLKNSLMN